MMMPRTMAKRATEEYPIVYHDNGRNFLPDVNRGYLYWNIIKKQFFKDKSVYHKFKKPDELDIILSHNYRIKPIAQRCLEYLGIFDYMVTGQDVDHWDYFSKLPVALDYLTDHCKAEYVLYLDSSDVLVCDDPGLILKRFIREFDCEVLFNAEKNPHPTSRTTPSPDLKKARRIEEFEQSTYDGVFRHLNAGCYIGRRESLVELFREAETLRGSFTTKLFKDDDQALIREVHRKFYPRMMIDSECKIFQTMFFVNRNEVSSKYPITCMDVARGYLQYSMKKEVGPVKTLLNIAWPARKLLGLTRLRF